MMVAAGSLASAQLLHSTGRPIAGLGTHLTDHAMVAYRVRLSPAILHGLTADDEFAVWVPRAAERQHHIQVVQSPLAPDGTPTAHDLASADVVGFAPVQPRPQNRLMFSDRLDRVGLPAVSAAFAHSSEDRAALATLNGDLGELVTAIADTTHGWSSSLGPVGASIHLMGTVRMAADGSPTVCDSQGRVHGFTDLYVAGNGVLGSANAGNPTLLTVALALRTAEAIA